MKKQTGILLPIFSLPSKYGIGSFGKWAYSFVDFLKKSGQEYWQILPLVQTGYCDSPYQTTCDISGNPYFIDLEILRTKRLLTYREVEAAIDKSDKIDYGKLYLERYPLLRKAFSRFNVKDAKFTAFIKKGEFSDYALFMALSQKFNSAWYDWADEYKYRNQDALEAFAKDNHSEILFWQFLQFEFWSQYTELKKYANSQGISIIGDIPLYVSYNSVDVWVNPKEFMLDEKLCPKKVAGVPPDYFSEDGQLWGNPCYDYEYQKSNGYAFWVHRMERAQKIYDLVRIDHFRGLDRFWAVPYGEETARNGEWLDAPGREIFEVISTEKLLAEDLGLIDDGVKALIKDVNIPNMKVLSFAFDSNEDNLYLPWNMGENCVVYTGTHDNDTLVGYLQSLTKEQLAKQKVLIKKSLDYLKLYKPATGIKSIAECIIDIAYASPAKLSIIPMHDILLLDGSYRINTPGSVGSWRAKIKESVLTDNLALSLKRKAKRFDR